MTARQRPIGRSRWAFADATVIVLRTPAETMEFVAGSDGVPMVMAFTDVDAARARCRDGDALAQLSMAELAELLPLDVGIVVDIDARAPLRVAPEDKPAVVDAGSLFPDGATVAIGELPPEAGPAIDVLREALDATPGVRGAHFVAHQVEDASRAILLILDTDDVRVATDNVVRACGDARIGYPIRALRRDLVPASQEHWLAGTPSWAPGRG